MKQKNNEMKKILLYNLIGLVAALALCKLCRLDPGYEYLLYRVKGDYHFARQNRHLPLEDRYASKMGGIYTFSRYIRENTPEDAVIYLPDAESFIYDAHSDLFYSHHCASKLFSTRFLYPRKIVTKNEYSRFGSPFPLTHVIVIGNGGKDILPYETDDTTLVVLPIHKPFCSW